MALKNQSDLQQKKTFSVWIVISILALSVISAGAIYLLQQSRNETVIPLSSSDKTGVNSGTGTGSYTKATPIPTLTQTDTTADIEKDLNGVSVGTDEQEFSEIQTDLQTL